MEKYNFLCPADQCAEPVFSDPHHQTSASTSMRSISIPVESTVLRRLMFLKHLQDMRLSTEAGLALIQHVDSNSDSAADRAIVITVIRAT